MTINVQLFNVFGYLEMHDQYIVHTYVSDSLLLKYGILVHFIDILETFIMKYKNNVGFRSKYFLQTKIFTIKYNYIQDIMINRNI